MGRLSQALYSAISNQTLRVFPDPLLESEILSLRVVQTAGGWKVDHQSGGYSDRAIALALAILPAVEKMRKPELSRLTPDALWK